MQAESVGSMRVGSRWPAILAALLVCLLASLLLAVRLEDGITFLSFWDEATHVLGGKVLDSGGTLYRSFVDSHGPFIFLLTAIYGRLFGWSDPNMARLINVVLVVASAASIAACPALRTPVARLWGVGLFAGLLAAVWLPQGLFMISYYPVAGALAGLVLTGFTLGCWQGVPPSRAHAILAGLAAACVVGTAYSYGPSVLLFSAAGLWSAWVCGSRQAAVGFLAGLLAGGIGLLLWLLIFADVRGYLAFHFAESQFDYARYIHFSAGRFVRSLLVSAAPDRRVHGLAVAGAAAAFAMLAAAWTPARQVAGWRRLPALAAVFLGVMLLNARGEDGFQDGSFVYATIVVLAVALAGLLQRLSSPAAQMAGSLAVLLAVGTGTASMRGVLYMPSRLSRPALDRTPRWPVGSRSDGLLFRHIRELARPDEGILAVAYDPQVYLLADRMPMDGFYAYFAWDADYARSPWFGRPRDLCVALRDRPPPVILYKDEGVWGYRPSRYVPCVLALLRRSYVEDRRVIDQRGALYVRRDRAALIR